MTKKFFDVSNVDAIIGTTGNIKVSVPRNSIYLTQLADRKYIS